MMMLMMMLNMMVMMMMMMVVVMVMEYGDSPEIAATVAIAKKEKEGEVRVIFDGSHGCEVNPGIRVRDQVKCPTSADGKATLSECAEEGGPHFSVHVDFLGAHRQVGVLQEDWGRQACQISGTAAEASK